MIAGDAVAALRTAGARVAVAESLTGGRVLAALTEVPGASEAVLGGVVAYTVATKQRLLGLPPELLDDVGPVHPSVARAMALAVARGTGADIGVATTGVAGPQAHGGHPPGVAFIGWCSPSGVGCIEVHAVGDRGTVRDAVTRAALEVITLCSCVGTVRAGDLMGAGDFSDRE